MLVTTLSPGVAGVVLRVPTTWPCGVDLELLLAGDAPQLRLVLVLETGLAEGVAGLVALGGPGRELGRVDGAHVAEDLGGRIALWAGPGSSSWG